MAIHLLDENLLVALRIDAHAHHDIAQNWFSRLPSTDRFATCGITEGTLLRVHLTVAEDGSSGAAWTALEEIQAHPRHVFWVNGFSYATVSCIGLTGRTQVTDAWLAQLARRRGGRLATLDASLAELHSDVADLVGY